MQKNFMKIYNRLLDKTSFKTSLAKELNISENSVAVYYIGKNKFPPSNNLKIALDLAINQLLIQEEKTNLLLSNYGSN